MKNSALTKKVTVSGGSVIFDGVSESSKFNINNATYKISGNKLSASN